ncbi:MAG TPA: ATP-dependent helicase [Anaerolineae bacterium]|nr:ATP-dependent helicase [Anaerolineae bacterium]
MMMLASWQKALLVDGGGWFGVGRDCVETLVAQVEGRVWRLSAWEEGGEVDGVEEDGLWVVVGDVPLSALEREAWLWLVEGMVYRCWLEKRPFLYLSLAPLSDYVVGGIEPRGVHEAPTEVEMGLWREQLVALLSMMGSGVWCKGERVEFGWERLGLVRVAEGEMYLVDDNLDPEQAAAAYHVSGPMRVLAPAGSGKTKTLTNRLAHLLNEGVGREHILALAFNKKAQEEMDERLVARGMVGITVRTFHALGYQIVRDILGWGFEMGGDGEMFVLKRALQGVGYGAGTKGERLRLLGVVQKAKNECWDLGERLVVVEGEERPLAPLFQAFLAEQARAELLTFTDMVYLAVRLLLKEPVWRRRYQQMYRYLLVDEFQDLNQAQMWLLAILAQPENHLFVVGDDDQMIYGWRGAEVGHILGFLERYPTAKSVILKTNYRCGRDIVTAARQLIQRNETRVVKNMVAWSGAVAGEVRVVGGESLWAQAQVVAAEVVAWQAATGAEWSACAILHRYRAYIYPLALALQEVGVACTAVDFGALWRHWVGRVVYACLTAVYHPDKMKEDLWHLLGAGGKERVAQVRLVAMLPSGTVATVLAELGRVWDWPGGLAGDGGEGEDGGGAAVMWEVLFNVAVYYEDVERFYAELAAGQVGDGEGVEAEGEDEGDKVVLSTIHQAKGKEWPCVVYFNVSMGGHSHDWREIEEERRVAYVAVTRAKLRLIVTVQMGGGVSFFGGDADIEGVGAEA